MAEDHQQLFGTTGGRIQHITLHALSFRDGHTTVSVSVHTETRRDPMTLDVTVEENQSVKAVTGSLAPLVGMLVGREAGLGRRHLWAHHDRLGRLGFQVKLAHAGNRPK